MVRMESGFALFCPCAGHMAATLYETATKNYHDHEVVVGESHCGTVEKRKRARIDLGKATGGHPGLLGEDHPNTRLAAKQVVQIRKLYATGKFQQKDLAARFNVSRPAFRKVVGNLSWK
jgi:hypothetical protein